MNECLVYWLVIVTYFKINKKIKMCVFIFLFIHARADTVYFTWLQRLNRPGSNRYVQLAPSGIRSDSDTGSKTLEHSSFARPRAKCCTMFQTVLRLFQLKAMKTETPETRELPQTVSNLWLQCIRPNRLRLMCEYRATCTR